MMTHLQDALQWGTHRLATAGVASPRLDASLLMALALRTSREALIAERDRELNVLEEAAYRRHIKRREHREPVSHITGLREFWSLEFQVSDAVLDPRPDSETLVETALRHIDNPHAPLSILDLGTGSGCLLLALLHACPQACGVGMDISAGALEIAQGNAKRLGLSDRVRWHRGDWADGLPEGGFDIIISNPPYIATGELHMLQPEVRDHEPMQALYGGADGLEAYRALAVRIPASLKPEGFAVIEIGAKQDDAVIALFTKAGCAPAGRFQDLAGITRCLMFTHPKEKNVHHEYAKIETTE